METEIISSMNSHRNLNIILNHFVFVYLYLSISREKKGTNRNFPLATFLPVQLLRYEKMHIHADRNQIKFL